jgi:hypothetical protein
MRIEVPVGWTVLYKCQTASSAAGMRPPRTVKLQRTSVYVFNH